MVILGAKDAQTGDCCKMWDAKMTEMVSRKGEADTVHFPYMIPRYVIGTKAAVSISVAMRSCGDGR
jgi:hypothetical protein